MPLESSFIGMHTHFVKKRCYCHNLVELYSSLLPSLPFSDYNVNYNLNTSFFHVRVENRIAFKCVINITTFLTNYKFVHKTLRRLKFVFIGTSFHKTSFRFTNFLKCCPLWNDILISFLNAELPTPPLLNTCSCSPA